MNSIFKEMSGSEMGRISDGMVDRTGATLLVSFENKKQNVFLLIALESSCLAEITESLHSNHDDPEASLIWAM